MVVHLVLVAGDINCLPVTVRVVVVMIPVSNVQQVITMTKIFIALQATVAQPLRVEFANLVLLEHSIQMYNKYINPLAKRVRLELGHLLGVGRVIYVQLDGVK